MIEEAILQDVCNFFEIGTLKASTKMHGARSHHAVKVETSQGLYVVKMLLNKPGKSLNLDLFRNTEAIAYVSLKANLPAIPALIRHNDVIFSKDDQDFMVYPYVDAQMIKRSAMSVPQCGAVASFLARLHNLNLKIPAAPVWKFSYHPQEWQSVITTLPKVAEMVKTIQDCFEANTRLQQNIVADVVVSHRDLDQNNILWRNETDYVVIDWELAGFIDAATELMYVTIAFSMETASTFNFEKFTVIVTAYLGHRAIKTTDAEPLIYCVLANWLSWAQGQLHRVVVNKPDLAQLNSIIVGVRHSLEAFAYVLSIKPKIIAAWAKILT